MGKVSNICLVTALKLYLNINKHRKSSLFLHTKNGMELIKIELTSAICSIIKDADPEAKAKVHDIRKMAASLSFKQDMDIDDLTEEFNWSSSATFYKHYCMPMGTPGRPIALPKRRSPQIKKRDKI